MLKILFSKPLSLYDDGSRIYPHRFKTCREILNELKYDMESSKSIFSYQQYFFKDRYNKYVMETDKMEKRNEVIKEINEIIEDSIEDNKIEISKVFSRVQFTGNDILVTMKCDGRVFSIIDTVNYWRER